MPKEGKRVYDPQVVYVGRLSKEKGVDLLIRAFERLDDGHLLIIGSGSEERELKRLAEKCDRIHFLGFLPRDQALLYVKGSDVFVLPSRSEGLSTALLEAMACGTAVIATSVGGSVELVEHGVSGLLVPPEDHKALADALRLLLSDASLRRRLAAEAARRVRAEFSMEVIAQRYLEVYSS